MFLVCPNGFVVYGGRCYGVMNEVKNWTEARTSCSDQREGYDLAIIKDKATNEFIKGEIDIAYQSVSSYQRYWIGLKENLGKANYVWNDGTGLTLGNGLNGYPWFNDEPNQVYKLS